MREAFTARGHDATSCDLLPTEIPGQHIQGDVLEILNDGWDMMIGHPPCTFLSNAGACRLYPRKGELNQARYEKGLQGKLFFMQLLNAKVEKIVIENPVPSKIFGLPLHSQDIQPYQFGHPWSKKTRLWIKGLPLLVPTQIVAEYLPFIPAGTSRKIKSKYGARECAHNGKPRSVTFPGIANAMAEQWG